MKEGATKRGTNEAGKAAQAGRTEAMPDVQSLEDRRRIAIDKVGVKNVTYPLTLRTPDGGTQTTVATINMYVSLPHHQKGTHMSRFLEALNEHGSAPITPDDFPRIAREIKERLNAEQAHLELSFVYFVRKLAPVTKSPGLMDYRVTFEVTVDGTEDFVMGVRAPATSLCPCSKEISRYGAHNQRCEIEARVRFGGQMWIECLAQIMEKAASAEVYAVLKRPDEKFVTERAFENPKFVEDIVRDLAIALDEDERVTRYTITSENFESIHNHNAYAQITKQK
jgi:GTP cyclohydrolase I